MYMALLSLMCFILDFLDLIESSFTLDNNDNHDNEADNNKQHQKTTKDNKREDKDHDVVMA